MEPRAGLCVYEKTGGRWTLTAPGQGVFGMKNQLADILGVAQDKVRMCTWHVGVSFGMKGSIYPDALRELGIPHLDMPASPRRVWEAIQRIRS